MKIKTSNYRILIVDDSPINIRHLASILKKEGYQILVATNGQEALDMIDKKSIDLILLDIMMPVMDGYEACEKIKKIESMKHIPVVFLTSLNDIKAVVKAFNLGAVDFINKPFVREELLMRVRTHIVNLQVHRQEVEMEKLNTIAKLAELYSHEILNPLNLAVGFLENLPHGDEESEVFRRQVESAHHRIEDFVKKMNKIRREDDLRPLPGKAYI